MPVRRPDPIATGDQLDAIAYLVAAIRPEWDRAGIRTALAKAQRHELGALTRAAVTFALERTDQRTPAAIGADGKHWHSGEPTWTGQPEPYQREPRPPHDPDRTAARAAAARTQLRPTRTKPKETPDD